MSLCTLDPAGALEAHHETGIAMRSTVKTLAAAAAGLLALSTAVLPAAANDGGGEWVPAPSEDFDAEGCGTTLHVSSPVDEQRARTTTDSAGNTIIETRGRLVTKIVTDDGRQLRKDITGPVRITQFTRGDTMVELTGRSMAFPGDPAQAAEFVEEGLPEIWFSAGGKTILLLDAQPDDSTVPVVVQPPLHPRDVCSMLRPVRTA